VNGGLARLAFRRSLPPAVIAFGAALALLCLPRDWSGANALLQAASEGADPAGLDRGLVRQGVWTVVVLALLPLFVARSTRVVPGWRAGEGEWLGSRVAGRGSILVSTWLGTFAGGALVLTVAALAIEFRGGYPDQGAASFRRSDTIALPPGTESRWIDASTPLRWRVAEAPPDGRVRVELGFGASSGSAAEIAFRTRRDGEERQSRSRISGRGSVEVEIPPGSGDLELELACTRSGTRSLVISRAVETWVPCASDRLASAGILLRLLLALATWEALAIGIGAWVSAPTAGLFLLAAWSAPWLGGAAPVWLPGADLWAALEDAGRGRVPPFLDPRCLIAGAGLGLLGLGLAAAGLRRWRGAT